MVHYSPNTSHDCWIRVVCASCLGIYICFIIFTLDAPSLLPAIFLWRKQSIFENYTSELEINSTQVDPWDTCELPKYDIWDEELIPYLNFEINYISNCNKSLKPLTQLKNGRWHITNPKLNVTCRTRCHTRKTERSNLIGNWSFTPGPVDCEVLEAVCAKNKEDIYGYLHTQVIPTPPKKPNVDAKKLQQYDVIVILLDSLSYTQARRSLLRTISYMTNHLNAVLFPYMNKVGDNSRPNGVALWFGKSLEKCDRSLFDEGNVPADWSHDYMCNVFKDNESSLFSEFQNYGYKTLLAEDWAEGTLNWPSCKGFDKPPIDHLMRPFQNAMERRNHGEKVTKNHLKGIHMCREHHHAILDYLGQFLDAYDQKKKEKLFSWIWLSFLGHDTENGFIHSDEDFHSFLVQHRKQLDNSFVFFMGDHGLRFGKILKTFIGSLDVNNPFLAISIPKDLRESTDILKILNGNAQKIQTHYDTRATFLDILKYQSTTRFSNTSFYPIPGEKGYSLIRKQPNVQRSCRNIPTPLQYCICQINKTVSNTTTDFARSIGKTVTEWVNQEIKNANFTNYCIKMEINNVVKLLKFDQAFNNTTLYTTEVKMKEPSDAQYKANIKISNTGAITVLGTVERKDSFRLTANCITSEHHRPFCYCKKQPKSV